MSTTDQDLNQSTIGEMWLQMTIGTVITCSISYFFAGLFAARVFRKWYIYLWVSLVGAAVGALVGFITGALPAFLLSLMYNAIPYYLSSRIAAALGTSQGLLIVYFQLGRGL